MRSRGVGTPGPDRYPWYGRVHCRVGISFPAFRKGRMAHRILLVEDEVALRSLAARALRLEDYEVTEASDGFEAWGIAKMRRFDLVITDTHMPRLSGSEFVARVRDLHPTLPVLRICGSHYYVPQEIGVRTLFKPFTIDELTQMVRLMLAN
jgi:two-component system, cell cycle sensor histidine kinase and response regulator CckA